MFRIFAQLGRNPCEGFYLHNSAHRYFRHHFYKPDTLRTDFWMAQKSDLLRLCQVQIYHSICEFECSLYSSPMAVHRICRHVHTSMATEMNGRQKGHFMIHSSIAYLGLKALLWEIVFILLCIHFILVARFIEHCIAIVWSMGRFQSNEKRSHNAVKIWVFHQQMVSKVSS